MIQPDTDIFSELFSSSSYKSRNSFLDSSLKSALKHSFPGMGIEKTLCTQQGLGKVVHYAKVTLSAGSCVQAPYWSTPCILVVRIASSCRCTIWNMRGVDNLINFFENFIIKESAIGRTSLLLIMPEPEAINPNHGACEKIQYRKTLKRHTDKKNCA